MTSVMCPRCGLTEAATERGDAVVCPRCLARSGGTLSIPLEGTTPTSDGKRTGATGRRAGRAQREGAK
jgi:NMD protein affecting ribosome stability and mRNA decay